ncbi:MAG: tetratricopeptide repeat protein [Polyangiales bacterium]
MEPDQLRAVTTGLAEGRAVAVHEALPRELPLPRGLVALRVRCGADGRPLGPWRDLAARAAELLGEPHDRDDDGPARPWSPRQRLLGRVQGVDRVGEILRRLARLAAAAPRGVALVFDDVDRADEATRLLLARLVERPGALPLGLALAFADPRSPEARELTARVAAAYGDASVVAPAAPPAPPAPAAPPRELAARLDADALLTLRAAAVAGETFAVDDVAALRELSAVRVLEHLQRAADVGVAFEDLGECTFQWPVGLAAAVRAEVLPSLARAWHRRLAGRAGAASPPAPAPVAPPAPIAAPVAPVAAAPASDEVVRREPPREGHHHLPRVGPVASPEDVFEPPAVARPPAPQAPAPEAPARGVVRPPEAARSEADHVRAARHLVAVGDLEGAARQLFDASREAASMGLASQSLAQGRDALALLAELPASDGRRRLRAEMLLALGTLQWHGGGAGNDFSLASARATLLEARAALRPSDPPALRGAVAAALAGVAGDAGDVTALDEALEALSATTRALMAEGATLEAARLLNDTAALHLGAGDPVRAAWLIEQARDVFERRVESMDADALARDPSALAELAETDHLYARLPLHAPARAGRGADALALGREHGRAALELYRRIGDAREVAGVLVTLGQLELRAGHLQRAREHLAEAMRLQESLGDVLGIARSSGALAEVEARQGAFAEAVRRLGDAVAFHVDKGSALGVALARKAFGRVSEAARASGDAGALAAVAGFEAELARAEELVGPARLPADVE